MTEQILWGTREHWCKTIIDELSWANKVCECGTDLPKYPMYDNHKNEIKECPNCGKRYLLIRKNYGKEITE